MHFDDEIISQVLLLKIVNFKLNCSFESFSTFMIFSLFALIVVSMQFLKKFDQNILEEDL